MLVLLLSGCCLCCSVYCSGCLCCYFRCLEFLVSVHFHCLESLVSVHRCCCLHCRCLGSLVVSVVTAVVVIPTVVVSLPLPGCLGLGFLASRCVAVAVVSVVSSCVCQCDCWEVIRHKNQRESNTNVCPLVRPFLSIQACSAFFK